MLRKIIKFPMQYKQKQYKFRRSNQISRNPTKLLNNIIKGFIWMLYFPELISKINLNIKMFAWLMISIAKLGFIVQYYALIYLLIVKNLLKRVFSKKDQKKQSIFAHPQHQVHPHILLSTHDFIKHEEFTLETYECPTEDGAYVTLWRIRHSDPQRRNSENPILIQHGLLDCSMSWFLHEEKLQTLPYVLASQGYDVWVGNNRGTVYSDRNSNQPGYWEFNMDHFIEYDQPMLINTVLEQSGKKKLIYIGHSQGSTQFLLALEKHPELKQKIDQFIGMGTVVSLSNLKSHKLIDMLARFYILEILEKLGFKYILNTPKWLRYRLGILTHHFQFLMDFYIFFISLLCGKTQKANINVKRLAVLAAHEPGGTSVSSIKHWIQAYRYGKFRKYDYGKEKNVEIYGTQTPPVYQFNHIKSLPFKTHIFRGTKDAVISDKDFDLLVGYFDQSSIQIHTIPDYAHLDYAWSTTAKQDIYDKIVEILLRNENKGVQKMQQQLEESSISNATSDTSFVKSERLLQFDYN